ncbi:MAG: hypothetical protein HY730_01065 [Candidatus Tectomicrobia bacterium]|uniref:DUF7689 domain-containing protein n=1 Tax=Tectimicrobiota bacterium TaxID=2528274 RepID=A0A933GJE4_UNCTE|nr:hypothetical protein [Candidatus Tectomicrobia bacterium]
MTKDLIDLKFPNLLNNGYTITSQETSNYNCIAWAAGDTEKWWWPDKNNLAYWPSHAPREENLEAFIKVYESLGYSNCSNMEYESGFEKIAIYIDTMGIPKHAAKQVDQTHWTSKLGRLEDIQHTLDGVSGSEYGYPSIFMKRPVIKSSS